MRKRGDRVRVCGLQARPELNGNVAVVLDGATEQEKKHLSNTNRIKVTALPQPLAIRSSCLEECKDESIDWSLFEVDGCSLSIQHVVSTSYGTIHNSAHLVDSLQYTIIGEDIQIPSIVFESAGNSSKYILHDCSRHLVHFLRLQCIYYFAILETYQGKARLIQCFPIITSIASTGEETCSGYSAGEWIGRTSCTSWSESLRDTHSRLGNLTELTWLQTETYVSSLLELQALAANIGRVIHEATRGEVGWSDKILLAPNTVTFVDVEEAFDEASQTGVLIVSNGYYQGLTPISVEIPYAIAYPFKVLYGSVVGLPPPLFVYLNCAKFGVQDCSHIISANMHE